jgi:hypothetical protein
MIRLSCRSRFRPVFVSKVTEAMPPMGRAREADGVGDEAAMMPSGVGCLRPGRTMVRNQGGGSCVEEELVPTRRSMPAMEATATFQGRRCAEGAFLLWEFDVVIAGTPSVSSLTHSVIRSQPGGQSSMPRRCCSYEHGSPGAKGTSIAIYALLLCKCINHGESRGPRGSLSITRGHPTSRRRSTASTILPRWEFAARRSLRLLGLCPTTRGRWSAEVPRCRGPVSARRGHNVGLFRSITGAESDPRRSRLRATASMSRMPCPLPP